VGGLDEFRQWAASHCEIAQLLGDRMGLSTEVRQSLGHLYERYDGKGMPGKLRGAEIPLAVRIMQVAQDAEIANKDLRSFLDRQMESLPGDQRKAIELAYFRGMSQREIAARTGTPLGTVKTRLQLGLQKLTQCIRPLQHKI
jgi:RNA polymerase sigma factor (sigma-70 family)